MNECPICHRYNEDDAEFCTGCGAELKRRCQACQRRTSADAKYCPYCGAPILTAPPVPWLERTFSADARHGLRAAFRGLAITMFVLAFLLVLLTPPPRIIDEAILMFGGALLWVLAAFLGGRKPKPPDDHDRLVDPEPPPDDGLALNIPDEMLDLELEVLRSHVQSSNQQNDGPYLN